MDEYRKGHTFDAGNVVGVAARNHTREIGLERAARHGGSGSTRGRGSSGDGSRGTVDVRPLRPHIIERRIHIKQVCDTGARVWLVAEPALRVGDSRADVLDESRVAICHAQARRLRELALAHLLGDVAQRHDARGRLRARRHTARLGEKRELLRAEVSVESGGKVAAKLEVLVLVGAAGYVRRAGKEVQT
jgi:hypothetical protein